jgi:hypothetical protein
MKGVMVLIFTLIALGCSGKLSEEDRRALREEMENREIRQIRDDEILVKAYEMASEMRTDDSLRHATGSTKKVYDSSPVDSRLKELWDAYQAALDNELVPEDNIQRDYPENLIYTYPVIISDSVFQMHVITIPRAAVVKSL